MGSLMSTEEGYLALERWDNKVKYCIYCYQVVSDKESLFKVYSKGKLDKRILCYRCLTNRSRRHKLSELIL